MVVLKGFSCVAGGTTGGSHCLSGLSPPPASLDQTAFLPRTCYCPQLVHTGLLRGEPEPTSSWFQFTPFQKYILIYALSSLAFSRPREPVLMCRLLPYHLSPPSCLLTSRPIDFWWALGPTHYTCWHQGKDKGLELRLTTESQELGQLCVQHLGSGRMPLNQ